MPTDLATQDHATRAVAVADPETTAGALTHYLGTGDLSKLSDEQRAALYLDMCASLGLNPRTRPFDWIEFWDPETKSKKLTLYPNRSCAEQLRRQHQISVRIVTEEIVGKLFKVVAEGRRANGVTDTATAYVPLTDKDGNALVGTRLANAFMKGQTVAKRRLTFSMVGMFSPPDPEEMERARIVVVDGTGRVLDNPTPEQKALAADPRLARAIGAPMYEDADRTASPLAGTPEQQPQLERAPAPDRPRATFRCDKGKWSRHWAMTVKGTFLERPDERHRYIAVYTSSWPEGARTNSLSRFFDFATDTQARDLIENTRRFLNECARNGEGEAGADAGLTPEQARDEAVSQAGQDARPTGNDKVRDSAILTGADPGGGQDESMPPERPEPGEVYTGAEWAMFYVEWAGRLRRLDTAFRPEDPDKLTGAELERATLGVIGQVDDLESFAAMADDEDDEEPAEGARPAF